MRVSACMYMFVCVYRGVCVCMCACLHVCRADKQGITKHYHIKCTPEGQHYLADKHPFNTIPELIIYHKHNCAGTAPLTDIPVLSRGTRAGYKAELGYDMGWV